jgi:uncharacterized protein
MSRARYVFDTNTLISALLFENSTPGRAFVRALQEGDILVSAETLAELAEVLKRKKFRRYVTLEEVEAFLTALVKRAVMLEPDDEIRACRDPKDDKFLTLAVAGSATCIVTGDEDLLVLHPFRGTPIVSAVEFLL